MMINKIYRFEVKGVSSNDQTWTTKGYVTCDFNNSFDQAMRASFEQLTNGKAVFGRPGIECQGPYDILSVAIEQVKQ
jgi:hypothetical protein